MDTGSKSESHKDDLISRSFSPFDHRGLIVEPFDDETKRDGEFRDSECCVLI